MTTAKGPLPPSPISIPADFIPMDLSDGDIPLHRLFERQAAKTPDRIAVESGKRALTYAQLNAAANRLAHLMLERYGTRNEPIALLLPTGIETLVAAHAIVKAGKIYAPIDLSTPQPRARYMLENMQTPLLLTDGEHDADARQLAEGCCDVINVEAVDSGPSDNPELPVALDQPTFLLHTSGSTGYPKGVIHTHRTMGWAMPLFVNYVGLSPSDASIWLTSPGVIGTAGALFGVLLVGGTIYPVDMRQGDYRALADLIIRTHVRLVGFSATVFRQLMAELQPDQVLSDVQGISLGNEIVTRADVELLCKHFPPNCQRSVVLGSTEGGGFTTYPISCDSLPEENIVPGGYPVFGKEVFLLDDDGNRVPAGEVGEIAVKGKYMSPGYWRQPELTAARFKPDPGDSEVSTYLSGDLGRFRPDGILEFLGRKDQQLKVRGNRVEGAEVELALSKAPGVKTAAVTTRPDARGQSRLVGYIVPATKPPPTVSAIRQSVAAILPDFMVPTAFVFLDALPIAGSGKVSRRLLPDPGKNRPPLAVEYAAPKTPIERALARIWSDVLEVDRVGVDDPFLDLGGHSLQAARIIARVLIEFRVELPVQTLFESGTVARMAEVIAAHQAEQVGSARLEELLRELEALPEDEAQDLLGRPRAGAQA